LRQIPQILLCRMRSDTPIKCLGFCQNPSTMLYTGRHSKQVEVQSRIHDSPRDSVYRQGKKGLAASPIRSRISQSGVFIQGSKQGQDSLSGKGRLSGSFRGCDRSHALHHRPHDLGFPPPAHPPRQPIPQPRPYTRRSTGTCFAPGRQTTLYPQWLNYRRNSRQAPMASIALRFWWVGGSMWKRSGWSLLARCE